MFSYLDLQGLSQSAQFGYAANVPFLKDLKGLEFSGGLTVIFGPNGSGKSTILRMLAESMLAFQGGVSTLTQSSISDGVDLQKLTMLRKDPSADIRHADQLGLRVVHDGRPVIYCDSRKAVGLVGGSFDDDFFERGLKETVSQGRLSHGQMSFSRLRGVLHLLRNPQEFPTEVARLISRRSINDLWAAGLDVLEARIAHSIEPGLPSVLLDEPESNLSWPLQAQLWEALTRPQVRQRFQLIVVTHCPLALGLPDARYIETEPGYIAKTQALLSSMAKTWA